MTRSDAKREMHQADVSLTYRALGVRSDVENEGTLEHAQSFSDEESLE